MKVTISQPRYLPALNYLQRICFSDVFVVFDIVQRQSRAWENRNKLLLPSPKWLTIPIKSSSRAAIQECEIEKSDWLESHKAQIITGYKHAPFFDEELLDIYYSSYDISINPEAMHFSRATISALVHLFDALSLPHNFRFASELSDEDIHLARGPEKLRLLCEQLGADFYISGENGREYGVIDCFSNSKCAVLFHCYEPRHYVQSNSPPAFVPYMGFFDALFNNGREWFREAVMANPNLIY